MQLTWLQVELTLYGLKHENLAENHFEKKQKKVEIFFFSKNQKNDFSVFVHNVIP